MLMLYLSTIDTPEDKEKFETIYRTYEQRMYAVAYKILGNAEDAEDVVHDTFQVLIKNLEKISEKKCHKTWNYIVTIVKNKSINLYQQKKRRETVSASEENVLFQLMSETEDILHNLEKKEVKDIVAGLVLELPERYRYVLYFRYYQECSYSEISELMDLTESNVRQIATRARSIIKGKLEERGISYE